MVAKNKNKNSLRGMSAWSFIKNIYNRNGIAGFYKGITASYFGISETIIYFVIYEFIKSKWFHSNSSIQISSSSSPSSLSIDFSKNESTLNNAAINSTNVQTNRSQMTNFFYFMGTAAISKAIASILAYPHGMMKHLF